MEQNQYRMYVDGNTVRKAEALPKDDRQERIRREREEQRARNRKIAKRNQAREPVSYTHLTLPTSLRV